MAYIKRENPAFSWTINRESLFNKCELCYGLKYYASHNGWEEQSSPLAKAAYRQKKTQGIRSLMSSSVLNAIKRYFYLNRVTLDRMKEEIRYDLNRSFIDSRDKKPDWIAFPKRVAMLKEMVFSDQLDPTLIRSVTQDMELLVDNFYKSHTFKEFDEGTMVPLQLESFHKLNLKRLDDLTVYTTMDLVYKNSKGKLIVTNFKVREFPSNIDHLGNIAIYASVKYRVSISDIIIRDEFLSSGNYQEYSLTRADIESMYDKISNSVNLMKEKLVDCDIKQNKLISLESLTRNEWHQNSKYGHSCPYCKMVEMDLRKFPEGIDLKNRKYDLQL